MSSYRQKIVKSGKIFKTGSEIRRKKEKTETLAKLHEIVPSVAKDEQVSKLELLQHVMDYIFQLQSQLQRDDDDCPMTNSDPDMTCIENMMQLFNASDVRPTSLSLC